MSAKDELREKALEAGHPYMTPQEKAIFESENKELIDRAKAEEAKEET